MEQTAAQAAPGAEGQDRRRPSAAALKVPPRGASSLFVGTAIAILSTYAVATLAIHCGKKAQEQRRSSAYD